MHNSKEFLGTKAAAVAVLEQ